MDKQFIKDFEKKVKDTIKKYNLSNKKDKIFVACSGGKDSTTVLYLLNKFGYSTEAIIIDLSVGNWSNKNLENLKKFCTENKIKLNIISMQKEFGYSMCNVRSGIQSKRKLGNCMICGVIKRWLLNKKSRELGAAKLATGHNLNDESETIMMNLFKGNLELSIGLGPKTGIIEDKKFVRRIKPLYFCTNSEVKKYSKIMKFPVLYEPCPCSVGVFRREIRTILAGLDNNIKKNIVATFLGMLPALRQKYKTDEKMKYCELCGEPSRKIICRRCQLINILKEGQCTTP